MRWIFILSLIIIAGCRVPATPEQPAPRRDLAETLPTVEAPKEPSAPIERPVKVNPTGDLTLQQALALALLYNPQLEAVSWHQRDQEAAILQGHLSPNPVLGLKVENFGGSGALDGFDGAVSTLRISQAIELGEKRLKRIALAQHQYALSAWNYETQRLTIVAQTGHRYIDVLAAQHKVTLAEQSLRLAEELYNVIEDRTGQGMLPTVEKDKAQVQVTARKIDRETQQRQLNALQRQLATLWDASEVTYQKLTGDLYTLTPPPPYDSLTARIEQNPDLARWATEITARQAAVKLADSAAVPNLTVGGGIRRFNLTDDHAFVFEVGIPLPISNRNQGARQQALYKLQETKARQRHAQTTAQATLHQLYQTLQAEHFAAQALKTESLPAAQAAYKAAKDRYQQGVTNYLHVLDAERTLISTQYDYIEALTQYHKTMISIEAFLGTTLYQN